MKTLTTRYKISTMIDEINKLTSKLYGYEMYVFDTAYHTVSKYSRSHNAYLLEYAVNNLTRADVKRELMDMHLWIQSWAVNKNLTDVPEFPDFEQQREEGAYL